MIEINATVGAAGVLALSAAALVSVHRVRKARARRHASTRLPDLPQLDEKLFFEVFAPPQPKKPAAKKR